MTLTDVSPEQKRGKQETLQKRAQRKAVFRRDAKAIAYQEKDEFLKTHGLYFLTHKRDKEGKLIKDEIKEGSSLERGTGYFPEHSNPLTLRRPLSSRIRTGPHLRAQRNEDRVTRARSNSRVSAQSQKKLQECKTKLKERRNTLGLAYWATAGIAGPEDLTKKTVDMRLDLAKGDLKDSIIGKIREHDSAKENQVGGFSRKALLDEFTSKFISNDKGERKSLLGRVWCIFKFWRKTSIRFSVIGSKKAKDMKIKKGEKETRLGEDLYVKRDLVLYNKKDKDKEINVEKDGATVVNEEAFMQYVYIRYEETLKEWLGKTLSEITDEAEKKKAIDYIYKKTCPGCLPEDRPVLDETKTIETLLREGFEKIPLTEEELNKNLDKIEEHSKESWFHSKIAKLNSYFRSNHFVWQFAIGLLVTLVSLSIAFPVVFTPGLMAVGVITALIVVPFLTLKAHKIANEGLEGDEKIGFWRFVAESFKNYFVDMIPTVSSDDVLQNNAIEKKNDALAKAGLSRRHLSVAGTALVVGILSLACIGIAGALFAGMGGLPIMGLGSVVGAVMVVMFLVRLRAYYKRPDDEYNLLKENRTIESYSQNFYNKIGKYEGFIKSYKNYIKQQEMLEKLDLEAERKIDLTLHNKSLSGSQQDTVDKIVSEIDRELNRSFDSAGYEKNVDEWMKQAEEHFKKRGSKFSSDYQNKLRHLLILYYPLLAKTSALPSKFLDIMPQLIPQMEDSKVGGIPLVKGGSEEAMAVGLLMTIATVAISIIGGISRGAALLLIVGGIAFMFAVPFMPAAIFGAFAAAYMVAFIVASFCWFVEGAWLFTELMMKDGPSAVARENAKEAEIELTTLFSEMANQHNKMYKRIFNSIDRINGDNVDRYEKIKDCDDKIKEEKCAAKSDLATMGRQRFWNHFFQAVRYIFWLCVFQGGAVAGFGVHMAHGGHLLKYGESNFGNTRKGASLLRNPLEIVSGAGWRGNPKSGSLGTAAWETGHAAGGLLAGLTIAAYTTHGAEYVKKYNRKIDGHLYNMAETVLDKTASLLAIVRNQNEAREVHLLSV